MQNIIKPKSDKEILLRNTPGWQNTPDISFIQLKKLTGLTNFTYQATNTHESVPFEMKDVLYRVFGVAEGLIDRKKEYTIFKKLGDLGQSPKCFASGQIWRIEEFMRSNHPSLEQMRDVKYRRLMAIYMRSFMPQ
ncbi:hypothetical protein IMG5_122520 [Ichthyophthirius multifiliis]|uniref:Uncharacterized protein n=1 Tax=Ichthyophthirius multifiliis TaxID=5932 RepID=G0QVA7_ICHMU|nr:hypothetical protein IMG5_122520 [Ichthyophthirius multifiliis]EGR30851.1 hypothetical protein IMG5_122520 [Ichthyophthirius multifiliis]|eukprot:XP_004032438.1 hypothetical protein IMG5_122520 [Ichthyophthirius multifiliis]